MIAQYCFILCFFFKWYSWYSSTASFQLTSNQLIVEMYHILFNQWNIIIAWNIITNLLHHHIKKFPYNKLLQFEGHLLILSSSLDLCKTGHFIFKAMLLNTCEQENRVMHFGRVPWATPWGPVIDCGNGCVDLFKLSSVSITWKEGADMPRHVMMLHTVALLNPDLTHFRLLSLQLESKPFEVDIVPYLPLKYPWA